MSLKLEKEYYYVCPSVFTIEKVFLEFDDGLHPEEGIHYYVERSGAYLPEDCIFSDLAEARADAFRRLNEFYGKKVIEIIRYVPEFMED